MKKVLIIGNGGREHAIGKKIMKDDPSINLYFFPGNGGTNLIGKNIPNTFSTILDLALFSKKNNIDLTIVGSEIFLMKEIVDIFQFYNLLIIGPPYLSARLEGDRIFSKSFMKKYSIKTPKYQIFSCYKKAIQFIENEKEIQSFAIKTNGIASGKGVLLSHNKNEAKNAIKTIMIEKKFGNSGKKIIIEEFIKGKEISILSIFNKKNIIPLLSSKDYKKIEENEIGLNTGGMGSISPNPYITNSIYKNFQENILNPTLDGLISEKLTFFGFLYFGLIVDNQRKVYLLEYNTRMGDPETQSLLPLMKSNFIQLLKYFMMEEKINILWKNLFSCCVIISSEGYPNKYQVGKVIKGLDLIQEPFYIAGAIQKKNNQWITDGGRVLNMIGLDKNLHQARNLAYDKIRKIHFENLYFRKDIGL